MIQYELALNKERQNDPQILACLGRVYLIKSRQEKNLASMKQSLSYSMRALEVAPEQIHFKFNVAFVQMHIAQLVLSLPESMRSAEEVETAASGLDAAIESFSLIAKSPNPPFPRNDIEQRASMGRNTIKKQLERAIQSQKEYEQKNAERLRQARETRDAEIKKREAERQKAEDARLEERRKMLEERQKIQERDMELASKRADDERKKEELEMTTDSETGERRKRVKKKGVPKRKKKNVDSETEGEGSDGDATRQPSRTPASGDERPRKRKRKLERKSVKQSKYKSSELIDDSDEDLDGNDVPRDDDDAQTPDVPADTPMGDDGDDGEEVIATKPRRAARVVVDDDEDDDEEEAVSGKADVSMNDAVDDDD
jgi:RNA polymerase-associated protein CTR9